MWHLVGAGALGGAAGPSPCQVSPAVARCGRIWPGYGRLLPAAVGPGQARPALQRCFGAPLYGSFVHCYSHICVPTSNNTNTARGTLLV
jgi:hypothetical protein